MRSKNVSKVSVQLKNNLVFFNTDNLVKGSEFHYPFLCLEILYINRSKQIA